MASNEKCQCGQCRKNINFRTSKAVKCDGECKKAYQITCVDVSEQKFSEIINNDNNYWLCKNCHKKKVTQRTSMYGTASTNTPTTSTRIQRSSDSVTLETLNQKIYQVLQRRSIFESLTNLK